MARSPIALQASPLGHSSHVTASERTPSSRILPRVWRAGRGRHDDGLPRQGLCPLLVAARRSPPHKTLLQPNGEPMTASRGCGVQRTRSHPTARRRGQDETNPLCLTMPRTANCSSGLMRSSATVHPLGPGTKQRTSHLPSVSFSMAHRIGSPVGLLRLCITNHERRRAIPRAPERGTSLSLG